MWHFFVSCLPPETEDKLVKDYVKKTFNVDFKREKIDTRFDSYASFKVNSFCKNSEAFFNASNWPEFIMVRRLWTKKNLKWQYKLA